MTDVIPHKDLPAYHLFTDRQLAHDEREYEVELEQTDRLTGRERAEVRQKLKAIQREQRSRKR